MSNKKLPLDMYPFMSNDLKNRENNYVTHEELNTILTDYVSKNNLQEMIRFKWTTLSTSGLENLILEPTTEAEWDTNSQIFYNFFKSNIEERSFKTYTFQKDLAKLFIRDAVDHVNLIVFRRSDTGIFGFGKNNQTGEKPTTIVGDTNYLYYFTSWGTDNMLSRPTRVWGNDYTPT